MYYEYTRQPPIRHLLPGPGQPFSISTTPPSSTLLPQGLDLAFLCRSPLPNDEDVEMMDAESSTVDVLTSGTNTDVEIRDGTAQDCSVAIVNVEKDDLDTNPNILLEEITAGIAALHLTNEGNGNDKLTERMGTLSINDEYAGDMIMEIDVTILIQSPLPAASSLPAAGPDDIHHSDVDTFEDDMHAPAQSTAMVTLNEPGPDNGPANSQATDELPPTPTRTPSSGTRNNTPEM